jgi:hypothetical protein
MYDKVSPLVREGPTKIESFGFFMGMSGLDGRDLSTFLAFSIAVVLIVRVNVCPCVIVFCFCFFCS